MSKILEPLEAYAFRGRPRSTFEHLLPALVSGWKIDYEEGKKWLHGQSIEIHGEDLFYMVCLVVVAFDCPAYCTTNKTINDKFTSIRSHFDMVELISHKERFKWLLSNYMVNDTDLKSVVTIEPYMGRHLIKDCDEPITVKMRFGVWPENMRSYTRSFMHDNILYSDSGCVSYIDRGHYYSLGYRPSCLDVWRKHLERKYFRRWRRFLLKSKVRKLRNVTNAIKWSPYGIVAKVNEYSKLVVSNAKHVAMRDSYVCGAIDEIKIERDE